MTIFAQVPDSVNNEISNFHHCFQKQPPPWTLLPALRETPTHLENASMTWFDVKSPNRAHITKIIKCGKLLLYDIIVKNLLHALILKFLSNTIIHHHLASLCCLFSHCVD